MSKSRPLLLLVITLCLLLLSLTVAWLSVLPRQMLQQVAAAALRDHGLVLEAQDPKLRWANGLSLVLDSVSLTAGDGSGFSATARTANVQTGWASIFGRSAVAHEIALDTPVIALDVSQPPAWSAMLAKTVTLRDGIVRLKDSKLKSVVSFADVTGRLRTVEGGGAAINATFLLNGGLATLVAEVEDLERWRTAGSPADITLTYGGLLAGFSGRAGMAKGLFLDGQLTAESAGLAVAGKAMSLPFSIFEDVGRMQLVSGVSLEGLSAALTFTEAKTGSATWGGTMQLSPGPDRVAISGALTVDRLSVFEGAAGLFLQPWSEKSLPLADLFVADADVTIAVADLALHGAAFGSASLSVRTDGNTSQTGFSSPAFAGGTFLVNAKVVRTDAGFGVDFDVAGKGVETSKALPALLGPKWLSGPLDINMKGTATGMSPAALVSTLAGTMTLQAGQLRLIGSDLSTAVAGPAAQWPWQADSETKGIAASISGKILEGVVTLEKSTIKATGVDAKPSGEVDLLRQDFALDLALKGKGLAPGLLLRGPWTGPRLEVPGVDPPALRKPESDGASTVAPAN